MPCLIKMVLREGYRNLDDSTDNILNDFIPIDIFPDTNTWGNHIDKLLSFNTDNIFNMMVWIVGSLFVLYVITIFIRRHNGEHAFTSMTQRQDD